MGSVKSSTKHEYAYCDDYDISTSEFCQGIVEKDHKHPHVLHIVKDHDLPNYLELKQQVDSIISKLTWWQSYGIDCFHHFMAVVGALLSFLMLKFDLVAMNICGVILLGYCHYILSVKGSHLAVHNAAVKSLAINGLLSFFFCDLCGSISSDSIYQFHIKDHHSYTNIIGIGDSSTWKIPYIPAHLYMFVTPLLMPIVSPYISVISLWGQWLRLSRYSMIACIGLCINFYLLTAFSGYTLVQAFGLTLSSRAVMSVPYLHVNIFQHIGLPMFCLADRPRKIYQMSSCVLNLTGSSLLTYCFGHSIVSAHIEHHLFPHLSDQQCLAVQPVVRHFLLSHGLTYNEAGYMERLCVFLRKYDELMVLLPPISHFVGIQCSHVFQHIGLDYSHNFVFLFQSLIAVSL